MESYKIKYVSTIYLSVLLIFSLFLFGLISWFGIIGFITNFYFQVFLYIINGFVLSVILGFLFKRNNSKFLHISFLTLLGIATINEFIPIAFLENNGILYFVITLSFGIASLNLEKTRLKTNNNDILPSAKNKEVPSFLGVSWSKWGIILFSILFLVMGMRNLGQFVTVDEPKWITNRVPQLQTALQEQNWEKTRINDKPGLLPATLALPAEITMTSGEYFFNHDKFSKEKRETFLFFWRLPLLIFNSVMVFFIGVFASRLYGREFGIFVTLGVLGVPVLLGISRIVNPDATLWSTSLLSLLTFFLYLSTNKQKYVLYSGIFLGLALLSKFFATILFVIFLFGVVINYLTDLKQTRKILITHLINVLKIISIGITIYYFLFPSTWQNMNYLLKGTLGFNILEKGYSLLFVLLLILMGSLLFRKGNLLHYMRKFHVLPIIMLMISTFIFLGMIYIFVNTIILDMPFFDIRDFKVIPGEKTPLQFLQFGAIRHIFALSLPLLFSFIGIILNTILFKQNELWRHSFIITSYFFLLIFLLGSSLLGYELVIRYQVMILALHPILFAFFLTNISNKKLKTSIAMSSLLYIGFILFQSPYYYNFDNILNLRDIRTSDLWGFGGYEAAEYLNKEISHFPETKIWIDREGFLTFYEGASKNVVFDRSLNPFVKENNIEYLVLTTSGKQSYKKAFLKWKKNDKRGGEQMLAAYTPILDYYNKRKNVSFIKCIRGNHSTCIWVAKIKDKDKISKQEWTTLLRTN